MFFKRFGLQDLKIVLSPLEEIQPEEIFIDTSKTKEFEEGGQDLARLEKQISFRVLWGFRLIQAATLLFLGGATVFLIFASGDKYALEAAGNTSRFAPLFPERGRIFSSDGKILAQNEIFFDLYIQIPKLSKANIKFDKILLDAPCSGEGTLRSSVKTFEMWNYNIINGLSRQQKKFIAFALKCLKQGGTLIYSTCTHSPEENESVISFALENFPVKIESISLPLKCREGIINWEGEDLHKDVKKACRIYPQDNDSEGFFLAKLTLMEEIK